MLATIQFLALSPGVSPINFSYIELGTNNGFVIPRTSQAGVITVASPTATPTPTPTATPTPACGGPLTLVDTAAATATRNGVIGAGGYTGYSCGINSGFGDVIGSGSKLYMDGDGSGGLALGLQTGGAGLAILS